MRFEKFSFRFTASRFPWLSAENGSDPVGVCAAVLASECFELQGKQYFYFKFKSAKLFARISHLPLNYTCRRLNFKKSLRCYPQLHIHLRSTVCFRILQRNLSGLSRNTQLPKRLLSVRNHLRISTIDKNELINYLRRVWRHYLRLLLLPER